jgi:hypothetical protein
LKAEIDALKHDWADHGVLVDEKKVDSDPEQEY